MSENKDGAGPEGIRFRVAEKADLEAIIALLADDPLGATRENPAPGATNSYITAFHAIAADPNNDVIVAELGGAVVGCLQLTMIPGLTFTGGTRAQIEGVRVSDQHRGQSIGRLMVGDAIDRARQRGAIMVQLTSNTTRQDALEFYRGLGFAGTHTGFKMML